MNVTTRERAYQHEGKVYLFRDVLHDGRFFAVEYGLQRGELGVIYRPCVQGAEFADVRPLFEPPATEDRKALPVPPDLFEALLKAIRETVRAEMRAEFEARRVTRNITDAEHVRQLNTLKAMSGVAYEVPKTFDGQPI